MNIGDIVTVKVDPNTNGGFDDAAAIVTGVFEDGSLRLRVFGANGQDDSTRNYVDEHGEPVAEAADPAPGDVPPPQLDTTPPADSTPPATPAGPTPSQLAVEVEALTPEQRSQLSAELAQYDAARAGTTEQPATAQDVPPPSL
jgi:hypothetical protein